jgi:phosphopantothenoylcysteine decarboxylase/phosphopantothenate--cysteine ligase
MLEAVLNESSGADVLIMAAAVADFRPKRVAADKMKSRDGVPQIELEATEDILKAVARSDRSSERMEAVLGKARRTALPDSGSGNLVEFQRPHVVIGFAAESRDLIGNASQKLKSKKLNLIVANDISSPDAGFGVEDNRVTLIHENGDRESLSLMTKAEVADAILERVVGLLE